jgi:hypothetical protein
MSALKIEKGVPLVPRRAFVAVYPFRSMVAGDSFLIPSSRARLVEAAFSRFKSRSGSKLKVAVRSVSNGKHRVWLLAKTNERMGGK